MSRGRGRCGMLLCGMAVAMAGSSTAVYAQSATEKPGVDALRRPAPTMPLRGREIAPPMSLPAQRSVEGAVVSVNPAGGAESLIVRGAEQQMWAFAFDRATTVSLPNGSTMAAEGLQPGARVRVYFYKTTGRSIARVIELL